VSFRKKNRKAKAEETKEEDVKVVQESKGKDKSGSDSPQSQQRTEQVPDQQSGQESGQPQNQSDAQSDEQSSGDGDDDKSDDSEPVPAGTTAEILKWVGDNKGRAQKALDKEQAEEKPRGGLTGELKRILE
jgi:hypothetical protein